MASPFGGMAAFLRWVTRLKGALALARLALGQPETPTPNTRWKHEYTPSFGDRIANLG
jgi:hypothetical protein